jgi:hypothetical protein
MIAAPLALLAATLLHRAHGMDGASWFGAAEAGPGRFYAAHLLILVAVALFAPAALTLADLLRPTRPAAARTGALLSVLGLLAIAVLIGMDLVAWQLVRSAIDSGEALALLESTTASPGVVAPLAVLLPGLIAGPALLALGLYRERAMPAWRAGLIPLGLAGSFAGLPLTPVAVAGTGLLVVALGGFGLALLRSGRPIPALGRLHGCRGRYRTEELAPS